jgi:hypothetical protein
MKPAYLAIFGFLFVLGCGDSGPSTSKEGLDLGGAEANAIGMLLDDIAELGNNPKKVEAIFAKGAKPSDLKSYSKYGYSLVGKPSASGTTGTCKVRIDDLKSGEKVTEIDWTFEKEGDKWKVKTAPLK